MCPRIPPEEVIMILVDMDIRGGWNTLYHASDRVGALTMAERISIEDNVVGTKCLDIVDLEPSLA